MKWQSALLSEISEILNNEVSVTRTENSDLITPERAHIFGLRLQLFHHFTGQPLTKKAFEYQLCNTFANTGIKCEVMENSTLAGADIFLPEHDLKISLKTEGAKSTKKDKVSISKLMEARWFRGCRDSNTLNNLVNQYVIPHLNEYDRILTLRSFPSGSWVNYELLEIPKETLLALTELNQREILGWTNGGSANLRVNLRNREQYTLVFDASVEKVTLKNLDVRLCFHHATWRVPLNG